MRGGVSRARSEGGNFEQILFASGRRLNLTEGASALDRRRQRVCIRCPHEPNLAIGNPFGRTGLTSISMETDDEKVQCAWNYRWSRVADCDAPLASMVAKDCGAIP